MGDATTVYYPKGEDYEVLLAGAGPAAPTSFPLADVTDTLTPTTRPDFLVNFSVDVTDTYYEQTVANTMQSDRCSFRNLAGTPLPSACADFDYSGGPPAAPTPAMSPTPTPSGTPVPPTSTAYFGTEFYRVRDDYCLDEGPVISANPDTTKTYVGGISIDIDRTKLGTNEDMLMNITYHAQSPNYTGAAIWPEDQVANFDYSTTSLQVNLVGTAQGFATLVGAKQPRSQGSYGQLPVYLQNVATFEDPFGSLRTEQVYLPLSQNSLIDRIRIERVRGNFHFYQIDLYRLGNRGN